MKNLSKQFTNRNWLRILVSSVPFSVRFIILILYSDRNLFNDIDFKYFNILKPINPQCNGGYYHYWIGKKYNSTVGYFLSVWMASSYPHNISIQIICTQQLFFYAVFFFSSLYLANMLFSSSTAFWYRCFHTFILYTEYIYM